MRLLPILAALLALALLTAPAGAQTLTIGSGEVRRGGSIDIPIDFEPGERDAVGFQLFVVYDPTVLGPPTCLPQAGVSCSVNHSLGRVGMIYVDPMLNPLTAQTFAHVRFPISRDLRRGTVVELGAYNAILADSDALNVPFTIYTGRIAVR